MEGHDEGPAPVIDPEQEALDPRDERAFNEALREEEAQQGVPEAQQASEPVTDQHEPVDDPRNLTPGQVGYLRQHWPTSLLLGEDFLVLRLSEPEALEAARLYAKLARQAQPELFVKLARLTGLNAGRV